MDSYEHACIAPGQWRLARVELYNWGTFDDYHAFDVSRDGLLITGLSGSGKSTIIDAISTVMALASKRGYNAAASNGGSGDKGRNYNNYVRGAYGHASNPSGETIRSFLRPNSSTWSGILLRFEDGLDLDDMGLGERRRHEPINLTAIFYQKRNAVSDDDLKSFYAVVRGDYSLSKLEPYGRDCANMAQFNKDHRGIGGQAWRENDHGKFLQRICSLMGIRGTRTLTLLQKTQAAKNIGSLNDLFRRYMLDRPRTFDLADGAVQQFDELENAHRGVVRQRMQMEMLEPLVGYDIDYTVNATKEENAKALKHACRPFTETMIIESIAADIDKNSESMDRLKEELSAAENDFEDAHKAFNTAAAILADKGGIALNAAEDDVSQRKHKLRSVMQNRASLDRMMSSAGLGGLPDTLHEFEDLRRAVLKSVSELEDLSEQMREEREGVYGQAQALRTKGLAIEEELRHLRGIRSNIPLNLHRTRVEIARDVGLSLGDLPFIAELIDVKQEDSTWQGAIERLLHNRAQTMLVDKRFEQAVSEYLETRHLGRRFQFDAVPDDVEVPARTLNELSLVRKVDVEERRAHPNHSMWVNRLLRKNFDYICVDSIADMVRHERAITRGGQVKSGAHHVKDDRTHINDRTQWVLGSSNDAKITQLEAEREEVVSALSRAQEKANALNEREKRAVLLKQCAEDLKVRDWNDLDLGAARDNLHRAEERLRDLRESVDLREVQQDYDEAKRDKDDAEKRMLDCRVKLNGAKDKEQDLKRQLNLHQVVSDNMAKDGQICTDSQAAILRTMMVKVDPRFQDSTDSVQSAQGAVLRQLDNDIEKAGIAKNEATQKAVLVMQNYKNTFRAESADLSDGFDERDGYINRYHQIEASGLARYEDKFLEVLADFSQDQITVIATEIRNAFRDVRERLEPVNQSLMLSSYAPGVYLQIEVREARSRRVEQFLADLREITSGSWETGDLASAEQRYERTAALMRRLKSSERADRDWRRECLNTPDHMKFIAREVDEDGNELNIHSNDEGLSGGQKQKLVFFCLAAALRYQLSDGDSPMPSYGTIILDEAFDKSDRHFAEEALGVFKAFHFHMILATPNKLLMPIEGHVGGVVLVECDEGRYSRVSPITW